jgi:ATP-binding cassette subfamily B (MDR/TAP) protein 7
MAFPAASPQPSLMKGVLLVAILLAVASSSSSCHAFATAHSSTFVSSNRFLRSYENEYRLLTSVRGGDSALDETSGATALKATAAAGTPPITTRQRYWRIARELGNHVWPKVPPKVRKEQSSEAAATDQVNDDSSATHANHISAASLKRDRMQALSIRYRVCASIMLMLAGKGVTIATPFLFKMLVDVVPTYAEGAASTAVASLSPVLLLLAYGICRSLSSLFRESTNAIFAHVAQSAIRRFGRSTFDHVHSLDLQYHLNRNTGTLGRVLERGSRSISFALNALVFNTIPTLLEVGIVTGIMFRKFGIWEAITVAMTIFIYSSFTIFITQWRSSIRKDMIALENKAAGKVSDSLLNYEAVKYFNNEKHEGSTYETTLLQYQKKALKAASSMSALNFGQNAIFSMGLMMIMYLTLRNVKAGLATVGDLVLVNGLLFQLSVPLNFIGWVYQEVKQAFIDMEAMFDLRDTKPEINDDPNAVEYVPSKDGTTIEFDEIEFAYNAAEAMPVGNGNLLHEEQLTRRPILKKTSFTIPQGKTVAIVGASGSGKSTLLRLLYRFYTPDEGLIRIGGKDASQYTTESVRKAIAVVPQDVVLFNDSIGYNIHYGNLNASWEDVIEASKKAHIHDIIMRLPNQYNTIVGERGLKMSGGEKQRVSLARAILKKAPILLCDEPTSSLDSQTELDIMNNLKEIGKDEEKTCVIIAHRLSTVQDCDMIVVMDNGRVVEQGTHDELISRGGRYSQLLAFQRSHPDNDIDTIEEDITQEILVKGS